MPFLPVKKDEYEKYNQICSHPEHYPPNMIVLPPGLHRWKCPKCEKITEFVVNKGVL